MASKRISKDPIGAARRKSVAARRVGVGSRCACGESRPAALIAGSDPTVCAECKRHREGKSRYDNHHVAGKANHPCTIPVPANDHCAILSEDQYDWPKRTRENPDRSPLIAIAACIRGVCSTIMYFLEHLLLTIPEYLEKLDAFLTHYFGSKWWTLVEVIAFTSEGALHES